jgi:ATP-dependent Clp protease ATP-binding subunit ClpA
VILFDEVEKAHPEVFNVLLQVLDDGRLTDSKGRVVNFKNSIIVMTSNIGSEFIQKMESIGFHNNTEEREYTQTKEKVEGALKEHFRPEFLNRIDEIMVFDILTPEAIKQIVTIRVNAVLSRLAEKGITVQVGEDVLSYLARVGYNPHYGARPLNRLIQTKMLNPIAERIIARTINDGDTAQVSMNGDDVIVTVQTKKKRISSFNRSKEVHSSETK